MSYTWFKLHHDLPDDIKLRKFTPQEKWAWVALLCLASKATPERGVVDAEDADIADYCEFNSTQDWLYYRDKLISKGMLEISPFGKLLILHWEDRQYQKPSDAPNAVKTRVKKHRERKKQSSETPCNALHSICNADETPQTRSDTELDPEFLSSSSSVVPKDIGVSKDTTPPAESAQSEIPSKQESPATELADKESSLAGLKSSDRIGGSAAKKTGAGSRKAAAKSKAAKVYSTLRELETFENLWIWYRGQVESRGYRAGDKALAAIAWRDVIEADWERVEEFRRGCSLFFKGRIESGIPHLCNFISGSTKHPTPYWQTALDDAVPVKAKAESFIPEAKTGPQIFTAKPFEVNPADAVDGLARMKAAMKQTKQELEAKNGLSA